MTGMLMEISLNDDYVDPALVQSLYLQKKLEKIYIILSL